MERPVAHFAEDGIWECYPIKENETPRFSVRRFGRALSGSVAGATEVPFLLL